MNDEEAFQSWLDEHPDDHFARMAFADWLQDRDDPRAAGYRALGEMGLYPSAGHLKGRPCPAPERWWERGTSIYGEPWRALPCGWYDSLDIKTGMPVHNYPNRRTAEDTAALAYVEYAKELTGAQV